MTLLYTLEATFLDLTTFTWVVSTKLSTYKRPSTSLCHTILILRWYKSEILQVLAIMLTIVSGWRSTRKWWCMPLLLMKLWHSRTTLLLPWLVPSVCFFVPIRLFITNLLFFNFLRLYHQPRYVYVAYQHWSYALKSFLDARPMLASNKLIVLLMAFTISGA